MSTEIVELKVDTPLLRHGMYVCRLDRPWIETPYEMQGFLIECDEDIEKLNQFCSHVFIDDQRSIHVGRRERADYSYLSRVTSIETRERLERLGYRNMRGEGRAALLPVEYPPVNSIG